MARLNKKIAEQGRKDCEDWRNYFARNIDQYHDFYEFVKGTQWTSEDISLLKSYKKVPLCVNKLNTLVRTLIGEQRQNTPNIEVIPDQNAEEQTAQVYEALVKNIAFKSESTVQYQTAFGQASIGGYSALYARNDYASDFSFDQDIMIEAFRDPTRCWWDISAMRDDKTDGSQCGFHSFMDRKKFAAQYGKDLERKIPQSLTSQDLTFTWANESGIMVADYFVREYKSQYIYLLSNNQVIDQEQYDNYLKETIETEDGEIELIYISDYPLEIIRKRKAPAHVIKHYKLAGDYELESSVVPSKDLPLVFVDSDSWYTKDGRQVTTPFVADAKDSQRYLNYLATQSAYLLKTSRYDQFLVSKENVQSESTQQIWRDPQSQNGALFFDKDRDGFVPQRLNMPELPASLNQQYERAMNDIYTSTGMYQARLGDKSNEISGKAIDSRTRQGSYSTYINFDALNRAITQVAQIVSDMIPKVYDSERTLKLDMPDTGSETVTVNQRVDDYSPQVANDLTKGSYTIRLKAGPSFEGQRQEAFESLQQVLQANPQVFQMIADLYAENLPLANSIELRNRLRTMVPPEIIEAGKTGQPIPPKPQQPDPQAIMAQLKQKEIEIKEQELQLKAQKQNADIQLELERLQQEKMDIAAKLEEQEMRYAAETHRTNTDERIAHADNLAKLITSKITK